jgi:hypothetical protein
MRVRTYNPSWKICRRANSGQYFHLPDTDTKPAQSIATREASEIKASFVDELIPGVRAADPKQLGRAAGQREEAPLPATGRNLLWLY